MPPVRIAPTKGTTCASDEALHANDRADVLFPNWIRIRGRPRIFPKTLPPGVNVSCGMPGIALRGAGFALDPAGRANTQEHGMPNRGELPNPAMRAKSVVKSGTAMPDAEAWTIVAFCTIGWLMSLYVAVSSFGIDAVPGVMALAPLG